MPESYEIDRDDPGYQRLCMITSCTAAFNVLDIMLSEPDGHPDQARGWHYGPQMFGGWLCPVHGPVAAGHSPRWVRVDGVVTGCECPCGGWMWLPGIHKTMGAFSERWAAHVAVMTERAQAPAP